MTQKDLIVKKLREEGKVSRNLCISGGYGRIITRLSDIILRLRQQGMDIETKEYENPKETVYILKDKPEIVHYYVQGHIVATKKIWL